MALEFKDFSTIYTVISNEDASLEEIENAFNEVIKITDEKLGSTVSEEDKESYDYFMKVMKLYAMNNTYGSKKLQKDVEAKSSLMDVIKGNTINNTEKRVVLEAFVDEIVNCSHEFIDDVEAYDGALDFL